MSGIPAEQHDDDDLRTERSVNSWLSEIPLRPLLATYELSDRKLGAGGFGSVLVGRKRHMPQQVAIKRIHADLRFSPSDQRRFVREVQLLAPLQHPNIVRVEDWGRDEAGLYIVMELIDGPNLATLSDQHAGPLPLSQLLDFTGQICRALEWAHQHGIVHRDLKPANLLLDRFGVIKLADFGLARVDPNVREGLSSSGGTTAFTYAYASPEQLRGDPAVDGRSDIYSLGATLYHLATGGADTSRTFDLDDLPLSVQPLRPLLAGVLRPLAKRLPDVPAVMQLLEGLTQNAPRVTSKSAATGAAAAVGHVGQPAPSGTGSAASNSDLADLLEQLQGAVQSWHNQARELLAAQRYKEAAAALEQIPEPHRHLLDTALYAECVGLRDEVHSLEQDIQSSVSGLRYAGLREKVQRLQGLLPWRRDLSGLLQRIPEAVASPPASTPPVAASGRVSLLTAPFDVSAAQAAQTATAKRLGKPKEWTNKLGMKFRVIPAGTFLMRSPEGEGDSAERPQHKVTITKAFGLGVHTVTQGQWQKLMGTTPWSGKNLVKTGAEIAATYVSWDDAMEFCQRLSKSEGLRYRLPREAEWEWSFRAGRTSAFSFNDDDAVELGEYELFNKNATDKDEWYADPVGQQWCNPFGLYDDLHRSVWEWCQDWMDDAYYAQSPVEDPAGAASGSLRVLRGDWWENGSAALRSADRFSYAPDGRNYKVVGFRVLSELE